MGKREEDRVLVCGSREDKRNPAKKRGHTGTMVSKFKFLKLFLNNYPCLPLAICHFSLLLTLTVMRSAEIGRNTLTSSG